MSGEGPASEEDPASAARRATEEILAAMRTAQRGVVVDSPPGAGKSTLVVTAAIDLASRGERVMVIAQTNEQVDDLADAYVRALTQAPAGTLVNIPGGPAIRFKEIAQAISQAASQDGRTESWSLEAAQQVLGPLADALALDLQFSGAKAQRLLGWKPQGPSIIDDLLHGSYHRGVLAS